MSVKESAARVKDMILGVGWIQGSYHTADGYCLVGAMHRVHHPWTEEFDRLRDAIRSKIVEEQGNYSILEWNDKPGRTKEDVLRLLDRIIEEEEP